jgi:hypothetical protein
VDAVLLVAMDPEAKVLVEKVPIVPIVHHVPVIAPNLLLQKEKALNKN